MGGSDAGSGSAWRWAPSRWGHRFSAARPPDALTGEVGRAVGTQPGTVPRAGQGSPGSHGEAQRQCKGCGLPSTLAGRPWADRHPHPCGSCWGKVGRTSST